MRCPRRETSVMGPKIAEKKGIPGRAYSLHRGIVLGDTWMPGRLEWRAQGGRV